MNSKLSVCIPTFNRREYLIETLESLVPQVKPYGIPIYISDNHSSDDTAAAVEEFARNQYQWIFINVNEQNLGFDANLLEVVSMASSDYVWLLPDDDRIVDDIISRILEKLEFEYSLLVLNTALYTKDFSQVLEERHLGILDDRIFEGGSHEDCLFYSYHITYFGSLVIKRLLWESVDVKDFVGSGFIHCWIVLNYIIGEKVYVFADPFINVRLQNSGWNNRGFELFYISWPRVIWSLPNSYRVECKEKAIPKDAYQSLKRVCKSRALGQIDTSIYWTYFAPSDIVGWKKLIIRGVICSKILCVLLQIIAIGYNGLKMLTKRERRVVYRFWMHEYLHLLRSGCYGTPPSGTSRY